MEQFKFTPDMRRGEDRATTSERGWQTQSIGSIALQNFSLNPMDQATAAKLVRRLLAGYPNLGAHDPEGYVVALVQTMSQYPKWAGERVILRVDEEGDRFPPTEKALRSWLNDAVSALRFAEQWNARATKQLAERGPDEPKPPLGTRGDGGPGTVYSDYEEAMKRHGRPHGRFEVGRQLR